MDKIPTLTNRELTKWIGILGMEKILVLHIDKKIHLSPKQLETHLGFEPFKVNRRKERS